MPGRDPCQELQQLLATMHALRRPGGCPWDAEQTPESLAPYILEEACETIEAIENRSPEMIADELGDLLLQIVFQAEIFAERQQFDFADVAAGITAKLRRRHPHVFGAGASPGSREELDRQWERIKREEQAGHPGELPHPLGKLPENLPALQRAQKLVARIRRYGEGGGWPLPAVQESAFLSEDALGDALLEIVQQAENGGIDAEQALRRAVRKLLLTTAAQDLPPPTRDK